MSRFLAGIVSFFPPGGVFLMQWYDPLNKFMLLKHFECSITNPPRVFEMIITPDLEYPIGKLLVILQGQSNLK